MGNQSFELVAALSCTTNVEAVYGERGVLRMEVLEEGLKRGWRSGNNNELKGGECDVVSVKELCYLSIGPDFSVEVKNAQADEVNMVKMRMTFKNRLSELLQRYYAF
ncbi:hypothetical protein E4U61_004655 [Claviceps capensis]|nr:hypothetical protein E4U61_004655 [Claviceps capensis]